MYLEDYLKANVSSDLMRITLAIAGTSVKLWEEIPRRISVLETTNPFGEKQAELDVFSNDAFRRSIIETSEVAELASEEMETPEKGKGRIHVSMDPLDGSSNIETNNPVGSIFCMFSEKLPCSMRYIAMGLYVTYGPMLTITLSHGKGVQRFVALRESKEYKFFLSSENLQFKEKPEVYSAGGQRRDWIEPFAKFVESVEQRGLKLRYCGTFVGDFNQILKHGGFFAYPALKSRPKGKLRAVYEVLPISYIAFNANGYASDGRKSIYSYEPVSLNETTPIYVGNTSLVKELEDLMH